MSEKSKPTNLHIVDFTQKKKSTSMKPEKSPDNAFQDLASKLENRISRIEKELRDSVDLLESDIHKLIKKKGSPQIEGDIEQLAKQLESRINKTISDLADNSTSKPDRTELKHIKSLSHQLMRILSFDFYKDVLSHLKKSGEENEVDEFGMDPVIVQKIKPLFDYLYFKYWRVETTGIENIPNSGRALVVANHSGGLPYDGAMLAAAIANEHPVRHDARFLVENFVFHMPILGSFMYRIGGVRACPENAERLLNSEHLVVVFPEGVKGIGKYFNQRYQLQRFGRGGFIKLCINTRSPLIPVGIVGAEEIHPIIYKSNILAKTIGVPYIPITPTFPLLGLLGCVPFPTKWSIHFGKPVDFSNATKEDLDNELQIHKLSENVRGDIQKILIELLKKRRSIWLG